MKNIYTVYEKCIFQNIRNENFENDRNFFKIFSLRCMKNVIRRCQRPNFKKILWLTMNQQVSKSWLYVLRWNSHNNNSWSFARLHNGYKSHGRSIFEFTNRKSPIANDGLPYTTLGYINGPGAQINKTRYIYIYIYISIYIYIYI